MACTQQSLVQGSSEIRLGPWCPGPWLRCSPTPRKLFALALSSTTWCFILWVDISFFIRNSLCLPPSRLLCLLPACKKLRGVVSKGFFFILRCLCLFWSKLIKKKKNPLWIFCVSICNLLHQRKFISIILLKKRSSLILGSLWGCCEARDVLNLLTRPLIELKGFMKHLLNSFCGFNTEF